MLKWLAVLRNQCLKIQLLNQTTVCCTNTMERPVCGDKPPPIGAFKITPLPVGVSNQTTAHTTPKEETSSNESVKESLFVKHCKDMIQDDACSEITEHYSQTIRHNDLQVRNGTPMVISCVDKSDFVQCNSLDRAAHAAYCLPVDKPLDTARKTSALMMKLSITGPPKRKDDRKRTVLPTSLLEGVTDLVKEQVKLGTYGHTDVNSDVVYVADNPAVFDFKDNTCKKSIESRGVNEGNGIGKEFTGVDDIQGTMHRSQKDLVESDVCCEHLTVVPYNVSGDVDDLKSSKNANKKGGVNRSAEDARESITSKLLEETNTPNSTAYNADLNEHCSEENALKSKEYTPKSCESISLVHPLVTEVSDKEDSVEVRRLIILEQPQDVNKLQSNTHKTEASKATSLAYATYTDQSSSRSYQVEASKSITAHHSLESDSKAIHISKFESLETSIETSDSDSRSNILVKPSESIQKGPKFDDKDFPSNTSTIRNEVNSFSEVDVSDLVGSDGKELDVSIAQRSEADVKESDTELDTFASELLSIGTNILEKKASTPIDHVYNLSDIFSGELERRQKKAKRKKFSKSKIKSSSIEPGDVAESKEKGEKPKRAVPNYFIAIQIKDPTIKSGLKTVQEMVVSENKKLAPALNKMSTLHLTLMVLSLETNEDMERSRQALNKASEKLLSHHQEPLKLDISGLGHFRNSVVFAKVKTEHQISSLKNIADVVEDCFMDKEIVSPDQRGFKPHITIMKLSSLKGSKKKGLRKIPEELYSDFVDTDFGSDNISSLQLCSMLKPKDKLGYYQVEHEVQFSKLPDTEINPIMSETSSDGRIEVAKESFDERLEMAKESLEVTEKSPDGQVEVAEESSDDRVEVANDSSDRRVEVEKESFDELPKVTENSFEEVAEASSNERVEVGKETSDKRVELTK